MMFVEMKSEEMTSKYPKYSVKVGCTHALHEFLSSGKRDGQNCE
jgi:hypothetical protein